MKKILAAISISFLLFSCANETSNQKSATYYSVSEDFVQGSEDIPLIMGMTKILDEGLGFDSGVNFFGRTHNSFYINNNGNISFNGAVSSFTPEEVPITRFGDNDIDNDGGGECEVDCSDMPQAQTNSAFSTSENDDIQMPADLNTIAMIAPFWADVDTGCDDCGDVFIGSPNAETMVITWD